MRLRLLILSLFALGLEAKSVHYELAMPEPHTHLLEVSMTLDGTRGREIVAMPVWTPGSYLVREFARNVQDLWAESASGQKLPVEKIDKNHWRIECGPHRKVTLHYKVYAFEHSVRTSWLDADHALINGASVFMYWEKNQKLKHHLDVVMPPEWSTISTSLEPFNVPGNTSFVAADFDELVDSPLELGNQQVLNFEVLGKAHQIAIAGVGNWDDSTLIADFSSIIETETAMFDGLPYDHYLFIVHAGGSRGGLEHKNSSVNFVNRWAFEDSSRYHSFLSLISHEFYHTWNIKRLFPRGVEVFDYDNENYVPELWIAEGITSYYDELVLLRAGLTSRDDYLKIVMKEINGLQAKPGRLHHPVADAGFDAWIKYYRWNEHSDNTTISYYNKGHLLGMLLDILILDASNGERRLDDVMFNMYQEFAPRAAGYTNKDFQRACEKVAGRSFAEFFENYVHGTEELPYEEVFSKAGLVLDTTRSTDSYLGARLRNQNGRVIVSRITEDGPAWQAGLNVNDEIVAIDGFRVRDSKLSYFKMRKPGDIVEMTVSRNGVLRDLLVTVAFEPEKLSGITEPEQMSGYQQLILDRWLGSP